MKSTAQKTELLALFILSGHSTFTAKDIAKAFDIDVSVARRRLEVLVADEQLERITTTDGYLEVSTGRTMKRKGVAYQLVAAK